MDEEYRNRIGEFLAEYINVESNVYSYSDKAIIESGIKLLIDNGAFKVPEMRMELLTNHYVLVPEEYILQCVNG